jgi:hypothetical protein
MKNVAVARRAQRCSDSTEGGEKGFNRRRDVPILFCGAKVEEAAT